MNSEKILVGEIGGAHGIKGEVRIKSYTEVPQALFDLGPLEGSDGQTYEITGHALKKSIVIARLLGVTDRNMAEALCGTQLFITRDQLPEKTDEDEFYHVDLIGLRVLDVSGKQIGQVHHVHNFGAGDILELRLEEGTQMICFTKENVPEVSLAKGFLVVCEDSLET